MSRSFFSRGSVLMSSSEYEKYSLIILSVAIYRMSRTPHNNKPQYRYFAVLEVSHTWVLDVLTKRLVSLSTMRPLLSASYLFWLTARRPVSSGDLCQIVALCSKMFLSVYIFSCFLFKNVQSFSSQSLHCSLTFTLPLLDLRSQNSLFCTTDSRSLHIQLDDLATSPHSYLAGESAPSLTKSCLHYHLYAK